MAATGAPIRVPVAWRAGSWVCPPRGDCKWLKNPVSQRDYHDAHLLNAALDIHADAPAYGYRFVADELADLGITASENRVWWLCSAQRIFSLHAKKRGLHRTAGPQRPPQGHRQARSPRSRLHRDPPRREVVDRRHRAPRR